MPLEFAIIPLTPAFLSAARDIQNKLNTHVKLKITITIDTNYETPYNTRINKWKKKYYDIITINNDSNSIVVRFSEKGSKSQVMEVNDFIDLVASFDEKEYDNDLHNSEEDVEENTEINSEVESDKLVSNEDGCCIM